MAPGYTIQSVTYHDVQSSKNFSRSFEEIAKIVENIGIYFEFSDVKVFFYTYTFDWLNILCSDSFFKLNNFHSISYP